VTAIKEPESEGDLSCLDEDSAVDSKEAYQRSTKSSTRKFNLELKIRLNKLIESRKL
jgi:hypothetical protein